MTMRNGEGPATGAGGASGLQGAAPRGLKKLEVPRRRTVTLADDDLVRTGFLEGGGDLPLVVRPGVAGVELTTWAAGHRDVIEGWLRRHGGILFRGFDLATVERFEESVLAISGDLLEYKERSSPRSAVHGNVYTSTDYPPDQEIFLHNENSYQRTWPMRIFFFCRVAPGSGGATPIADTRKVFARLAPEIRGKFQERGWMYVRNFGDGMGLDWPEVFQTQDRAEVERHCLASGIALEWRSDGRLRTRSVRPAAVPHPVTGEMVWFNHATFFHVSTRPAAIRDALLEQYAAEDLPATTFYGDGSPIEPEVLDALRTAYAAETVSFPWQQDDLLLLDNMMVAHGREPFSPPRQILVAMAEPKSWDDLAS
jgi:alpha-ketoglutarate-dependent taurine dioxygenase